VTATSAMGSAGASSGTSSRAAENSGAGSASYWDSRSRGGCSGSGSVSMNTGIGSTWPFVEVFGGTLSGRDTSPLWFAAFSSSSSTTVWPSGGK